MDKKVIFTSLVAMIICLPAISQDKVAGKISFETGGGSAAQILNVKGESTSSHLFAPGTSTVLRVNYHISNSWGVFLQFDYQDVSFSDADYFGTLNKADGSKYRYGTINSWNSWLGQSQSSVLFGGFYRLKLNRFALMPRFSVGIGYLATLEIEYQRIQKISSEGRPEYFYIHSLEAEQEDYLINPGTSYLTESLLQFETSLQVLYEPWKHFYFFMEPGLTYSPGKVSVVTESYKSKQYYPDPSNWVEAVTRPEYGNYWVKDENSKTVSTEKVSFAPFFFINFGIGVRF